jgi:hypothetical protein
MISLLWAASAVQTHPFALPLHLCGHLIQLHMTPGYPTPTDTEMEQCVVESLLFLSPFCPADYDTTLVFLLAGV